MIDLQYDPDEWADVLRQARDDLRTDPEIALETLDELARYAHSAMKVLPAPEAEVWRWRSGWAKACRVAAEDLLLDQIEECRCSGKLDPSTWESIEGFGPNDLDWWDGAEKRVEQMAVVGERYRRVVVWVEM